MKSKNLNIKPLTVGLFLITIGLTSCGIRWINKTTSRLNADFPRQISDLVYLKGDFSAPVEPKLVVGTLLIKVNDSTFIQTERQYCLRDTSIVKVIWTEKDPIYYSKITSGFNANGKYVIAELKASNDIAYELSIDRTSFAELLSDNIDTTKLFRLYRNIVAGKTPRLTSTNTNVRTNENYLHDPNNYYYIKAVQVNTVTTKVYTSTKVSGSVDGGTSTFGANGSVYASTEGFVKYFTTGVKLTPLPLLLLEYDNPIQITADSSMTNIKSLNFNKGAFNKTPLQINAVKGGKLE